MTMTLFIQGMASRTSLMSNFVMLFAVRLHAHGSVDLSLNLAERPNNLLRINIKHNYMFSFYQNVANNFHCFMNKILLV